MSHYSNSRPPPPPQPFDYSRSHDGINLEDRKPAETSSSSQSSHRLDPTWTPLHLAAESGNLDEVCSLILRHPADIQARTALNKTPLHIAVKVGHFDIVEALLKSGADTRADDDRSETPLHIAARNGHTDIVKALLKGGADTRLTDGLGRTPLHNAALNGHTEVVKALLDSGADIQATDEWKDTPLHEAADWGKTEVIEILLRRGADFMAQNEQGLRPLEAALGSVNGGGDRDQDRDETALVLLKSMTEEQALQQTQNSQLPLLWKVFAQNCVQCFHWVLRYSTIEDILAEVRHGKTLLFEIICRGYDHSEFAMLLLERCAPIKGVSRTGNTALHYAAEAGMSDVVKKLLLQDSPSHVPPLAEALGMRNSWGNRPIECACALYDPERPASEETVTLLLRHNYLSDPIRDVDEDWTALHWAVFYNRPDLVSLLVSRGADMEARDSSQRSPADLAESVVRPEIRSEMMKWLRPKNVEVRGRELGTTFPLTRPRESHEIEMFLSCVPFYIADMYYGGSIETSKFSIRNLLHEFGPKHIMRVTEKVAAAKISSTKDDFALRWIHLPANNKTWIQDLAQSIYCEQHIDELSRLGPPPLDMQYLYGAFHGQQHYFRMLKDGRDEYETHSTSAERLFGKLNQFIQVNLSKAAGSVGNRLLRPFFKYVRLTAGRTGPTGMTRATIEQHSMILSMPFLCFKKFGSLTGENENPVRKSLERHYAKHESIHLPLTLDEFYFDARSESADKRAKEQVVFRHQGRGDDHITEDERLICMVDQLWICVVDNETIVTSCSGNWDEGQRAMTIDVQDILQHQLLNGKDTRPPVLSPYGMVPLAIATCIRDSMVLDPKQRESLLQVFGDEIARATDEETDMFTKFMTSLDSGRNEASFTIESRDHDITGALELLNEVKDIIDELHIIRTVLTAQQSVMHDAFQCLIRLSKDYSSWQPFFNLSELIDFYQSYSRVDQAFTGVDNLIENASQVVNNINRLLDLRQKHANLTEAMWARQASEDTTRQGRTIMVFTVVTIIFLPITFLSSLFALDITVFPHNDEGDLSYTPRWAFSWLIGMTIAVSLPLILAAFFVNDIGDYLSRVKSRRPIQGPAAQELHEAVNKPAFDQKQKIHKKEQNGWKSMLRKRNTKQGAISNV